MVCKMSNSHFDKSNNVLRLTDHEQLRPVIKQHQIYVLKITAAIAYQDSYQLDIGQFKWPILSVQTCFFPPIVFQGARKSLTRYPLLLLPNVLFLGMFIGLKILVVSAYHLVWKEVLTLALLAFCIGLGVYRDDHFEAHA
jgi:hypothetical protein